MYLGMFDVRVEWSYTVIKIPAKNACAGSHRLNLFTEGSNLSPKIKDIMYFAVYWHHSLVQKNANHDILFD